MNNLPPLYDQLRQAQGGRLLEGLADQFGLSERDAENAVRIIMPELTQALGRNISSDEGLTALLKALASGNHSKYLDNPDIFRDGAVLDDGNAILGHLLGSKSKSRSVAARAAADSGIGEAILRQILPYLASLLMAWLSRQGQGGGGGERTDYPSGGRTQEFSDVLEDLSNITQQKTGGPPSAEQSRNPYIDLSDVLSEKRAGNKTIAGKIRDSLGSAIGTGGKGIIGWIISALIWRYGWRFVRHFLKRIF